MVKYRTCPFLLNIVSKLKLEHIFDWRVFNLFEVTDWHGNYEYFKMKDFFKNKIQAAKIIMILKIYQK